MKKIFTALVLLSLFGCGRSEETKNTYKLKDEAALRNPVYVGTLPNGQRVNRVLLKNTPDENDHYVYFTDNVQTTNINYTTGSGAQTRHHRKVYVQINGQAIPLEDAKRAIEEVEQSAESKDVPQQ